MARYALIDPANIVQNLTVWDGDLTKWQPPAGWQAQPVDGVVCLTGEPIGPGCHYNGGVSYTFGETAEVVTARNASTVRQQLQAAEADLTTLINQGATLMPPTLPDYATANLANLNDLLHKLQQVVGGPNRDGKGGVMLIAQDLRWVARMLLEQFDGTT